MNALSMVQGFKYDYNRHIWDVPLGTLMTGLAVYLAIQVAFAISTTLTKCSALLFFLRLQRPARDWKCVIAIIICATQGIAMSFMLIFQCMLVSLLLETHEILTQVPTPDQSEHTGI
jgi:hypothetical protein